MANIKKEDISILQRSVDDEERFFFKESMENFYSMDRTGSLSTLVSIVSSSLSYPSRSVSISLTHSHYLLLFLSSIFSLSFCFPSCIYLFIYCVWFKWSGTRFVMDLKDNTILLLKVARDIINSFEGVGRRDYNITIFSHSSTLFSFYKLFLYYS